MDAGDKLLQGLGTQSGTARWFLFLGISLLVLLPISQFAGAQDGTDLTDLTVEVTATMTAIVEATAVPDFDDEIVELLPISPGEAPTSEPATIAPEDISVMQPTEIMPTETSSAGPTVAAQAETALDGTTQSATVEPSATQVYELPTNEATAISPPSENDQVPTVETSLSMPDATVTITAPVQGSIAVTVNATRLAQNTVFSFMLTAQNLSTVANIAITCSVDPAMLQGLRSAPGELLLAEQTMVTDSGFTADGHHIVMVTMRDDTVVQGAGSLWVFDYQTRDPGPTGVNCQVLMTDPDGQDIVLADNHIELALDIYPEPDDSLQSLDGDAAVVASPTVPPVSDIPPIATTVPMSQLSGYVHSRNPLSEISIVVSGPSGEQSSVLQGAGTFIVDLPPGSYQLTVSAPQCLTHRQQIILSPEALVLPEISLIAGDVDQNDVIDQRDVDLLRAYYGLTVPSAPFALDLTGDGRVDIYDLAIVSGNLGSVSSN